MIFYFLICFFLGSIPTAYLVAKTKGIDIKKVGSGNSGATNVLRSVGASHGFVVMVIDILKGFLAVYFAKYFELNNGNFNQFQMSALGGFAAIIAHIYTPFLKFNGGKGVATSIGIYMLISPLSCLGGVLSAVILIYFTKKASIGTLIGLITLPIFCLIFERLNPEFYFILKFMCANILLVLYTHRENLKRILKGEELGLKK